MCIFFASIYLFVIFAIWTPFVKFSTLIFYNVWVVFRVCSLSCGHCFLSFREKYMMRIFWLAIHEHYRCAQKICVLDLQHLFKLIIPGIRACWLLDQTLSDSDFWSSWKINVFCAFFTIRPYKTWLLPHNALRKLETIDHLSNVDFSQL